MAIREEFDKYLLLKKLAEDPLGETFRAGRVGAGSLDQVVLLRVLNGPRLDGAALARDLPGRSVIQQALKSPNIGNGVDLGAFRGVPFLAYDYVSGRNLTSLLQQADQQHSPIPVDHALHIAERIALALAAAYETRAMDQRITHGFLVPHLVMISNEGETRVLGFAVGPLLARQASGGTFEPEISAYLAPELVAGQGPHKADDVYSAGAILYQLLTGTHPSADLHTHLERIDQAHTAAEGEPLPADVAALLKKSLAPRDQRFPEAVGFHRALSKVLAEGHYTANTFNLAFFMHNLFRNEIERESQELEAEKRIQPPPAAATVALPRAAVEEALAAPVATPESTGTHTATGTGAAATKSGRGLWLSLAALLLLAGAGGGGYYWYQQRQGTSTDGVADLATTQPSLPPSPLDGNGLGEGALEAAVPEEPEPPPGPTPEEVQAQLQAMIDARSREMEEKLKTQYDDRIRNLQSQLEETQQAAAARETERQKELERLAAERKAAQEAQLRREEEARKAAAAAAAPPPQTTTPAGGTGQPAASSTTQAQAPPEPPAPKVVQVKPPELLRRPDPRYPPIARRVGKEATVVLRVLVDARGGVTKVEQISPQAGFGIDQAAEEAARNAEYRPGTEDGKPKEMWTTIRFTFRP